MSGSRSYLLPIALCVATAAPADEPAKPVTEERVSAKDVAMTPATDLNIRKDKVPPLLLAAQEQPYSLKGLEQCPRISGAISELDVVLGPDIDQPREARDRITPGRVAQAAVSSFIPFRGLIREVSGANESERRLQAAIDAGIARRGFLKGYAEAKGCNAPAQLVQATAPPTPVFVSRPVVQKTP